MMAFLRKIREIIYDSGNYYVVFFYRLLVVMFIFILSRFVFYFFNNNFFPQIGWSDWPKIMQGGWLFDQAAILYLNALFIVLMLAPIPYIWRTSEKYQNVLKWIFFTFNGIGIALNCIDIVYYRFTLRRTTSSVFQEFSNENNIVSLGFQFVLDYWYVLLVFVGLIMLMVKLYNLVKIRKSEKVRNNRLVFYVKAAIIFLITIPFSVAGVRGDFEHSTRPITISNAGKFVNRPDEIYLVLNTPFCFIRTFNDNVVQPVHYFSDEELAKLYTPIHHPKDTDAVMNKKNVVLIVLESFGKEAVGFYNKDLDGGTYKGFTPFLDSLASVSKVYWNSFASGRKSIDALPSSIASIPSVVMPFVLTTYVNDSIQSLGHLLAKEGYQNSFFHGAPNGSMGFLEFLRLMGINDYYGKNEFNNDAEYDGYWGIWDEPFMQFFADHLNRFKEPFFSTFFSVSSHHPFQVPKQYEGKFKKGPLPVLECIGYTDMALRRFFDKVSKSDWFKNTIFVITADHATLSYHKEYQSAWGDSAIPILLYSPGDTTLRGIDQGLIQQTDIMPTVLGYLNYNKPFLAFGENVLDRKDKGFAFHYSGGYQWFEGDYLLFFDGEKTSGLYNYQKDRLLKDDLSKQEPQRLLQMENKLKAFLQQYTNRLIENRMTAAGK